MSEKSTWVEFRDKLVEAVKFETVTEKMKEDFTRWLLENLLPVLKETGAKFSEQTKEQAATENGWCKVRDLFVLPFIIQAGLWIMETALKKTIENTV